MNNDKVDVTFHGVVEDGYLVEGIINETRFCALLSDSGKVDLIWDKEHAFTEEEFDLIKLTMYVCVKKDKHLFMKS